MSWWRTPNCRPGPDFVESDPHAKFSTIGREFPELPPR